MKKTLVATMLCLVVLNAVIAPLAVAADPDFWGLDGRAVTIEPKEVWVQQDDNWSDGMMRFGDLEMALRWVFGFWTKLRW